MNQQIYESIEGLQKEIRARRKAIRELRQHLEPELVTDYQLLDRNRDRVSLSSLFGSSDELLVIHNMGKSCVYCTLWGDHLNGMWRALNNRVPVVMLNADTPETQREFSASRGWEFPMYSAAENNMITDLGFKKEDGYWPGVSALVKKDGKIFRASYDLFGPGDPYAGLWHFLDLLPKGVNNWQPAYQYGSK
ncbi:MAG: DUF899 family protein [Chitinophagales bacterium]